ncbi:MAG: TIGR03936 family radical SAM-associated protein [Phycisphaerae bacterium]|nr:TIGR03936 family radical SAM-associated protein [Phycisphaerae bacterium]
MRQRLAIRYAIRGDLRFLSHQDTLRLFQRAFARADIPVRYSEGFNPRPRISIAMPRPVGVESHDELMTIELASPLEIDAVSARLAAQLPEGIQIHQVEALHAQDRRLPREVEYTVDLSGASVESVQARAAELLTSQTHRVERRDPEGRCTKHVDIRAFLIDVRVDGNRLVWSQTVSIDGTARVGEVLEAVGLPAPEWTHRAVRSRAAFRD